MCIRDRSTATLKCKFVHLMCVSAATTTSSQRLTQNGIYLIFPPASPNSTNSSWNSLLKVKIYLFVTSGPRICNIVVPGLSSRPAGSALSDRALAFYRILPCIPDHFMKFSPQSRSFPVKLLTRDYWNYIHFALKICQVFVPRQYYILHHLYFPNGLDL